MKATERVTFAVILASIAWFQLTVVAAPPTPPPGARVFKRPFRLRFESYEGNKDKPGTLTFRVRTIDLVHPPTPLKLGDTIPNTKFKLHSFKYAIRGGANIEEFDA